MLFFCFLCSTLIQCHILFIFQVCSFVGFQNFISRCIFCCQLTQHFVQKCFCHIIYITICSFYFTVSVRWIHTKCHVGRQCPRCSGPCQKISILSYNLETYHCRTFFHSFITLCHFLCRQRCSTARTVRHDLKSFVQKTFIPYLFQCPPLGLNIIIMIRYIWIIHICPETNSRRKIFPHTFVFPDTLFTLVDERHQTVLFNLLLSIQAQKLFHFQFNRQTMGIPTCFSRYHIPFHSTVTWNHILNNTGQYMTNMWFTVCSRRSVIEGISLSLFPVLHTLFENMILFPEFFCLLLSLHKIQIR